MSADRFIVDERVWIITKPTGVAGYDFDFRQYLNCRTPYVAAGRLPGLLRIGAVADYAEWFQRCSDQGIELVQTPQQHDLCSLLPQWYPLIEQHTPRSRWFAELPRYQDVEALFDYPVFVKGSRQTSKHQAALSIVRSRADLERVINAFASDRILHWQDFVCREYVALRSVKGGAGPEISPSFEFRTFWWRGTCVGAGRYWTQASPYDWNAIEKAEALVVGKSAADALDCPFVVIDLAQTCDGKWIVIECNAAMESGYAGASPFAIWQEILGLEARIGP